jgi:monofunctional biosynthetic peptidoglycan transglycosylase
MLAPVLLIGLYAVVPPPSTLMLWRWVTFQGAQRDWVPIEHVSPHLVRAVIAAEDARFCQHGGVDWEALREVIETSDEDGPARGASTLTMQTAKNLFLWHGRSYIRKGLELPLAALLDTFWSKRRVLEVYLNIAEWGEGTFGAEAGARRAFRKSAVALTPREASLMAVALPNPLRRDPARPSRALQARSAWLAGRLAREDIDLSCLGSLSGRRARATPEIIFPAGIAASANPGGQG